MLCHHVTHVIPDACMAFPPCRSRRMIVYADGYCLYWHTDVSCHPTQCRALLCCDTGMQMFRVTPLKDGDDLYNWEIAFPSATFFESAPQLFGVS